jgi:glutathione S-transferase
MFDAKTKDEVRVKLYRDHASWCPYSQKIWMQLEEKRIPYTLEKINMRCYGPKPASFTSKVPSGALPVIELDGRVITESSVIADVLEKEFHQHKSLLPYAPGSAEAARATTLMRLERALFSRWMSWITSSWSDASSQSEFSEVLDQVDKELGAGGGPYFMGEEFTLVDIAYTPFLERMASSVLYYKGVKIEGNGGRWPHLDVWYATMANRKVYKGIKSDYYTTAHDLPPQLGGCAENGDNVEARDAIDGVDGVHWKLPLGPLNASSLEPWWGEDDPEAARVEAARRVIDNHTNIVRFAARGCGQAGRPAYSAPLSDPNAVPGTEHIPAVDIALRIVVHGMLHSSPVGENFAPQVKSGNAYSVDATTKSLAYLRDRVGVPRDMSYPAARQFRAHLNWAIDSVAGA